MSCDWKLLKLESLDACILHINHEGQPYTLKDFEFVQDEDLKSLRFYRVEPEMEIGVAADLLCRCLKAAYVRDDVKAVSDFRKRLEWYVRSEISRFAGLRDEVYQEIRQWGEENVGEGKSYPKTFLFPRNVEPFKHASGAQFSLRCNGLCASYLFLERLTGVKAIRYYCKQRRRH